jgi:hypothetical protein
MMHSYIGQADASLFDTGGSDLFGFDDLAQAAAAASMDPLSAANVADIDRGSKLLTQFAALTNTVNQIGNAQVKQGAVDIIKTKWYKVGTLSFLGLGGKYDLNELAKLVQGYVTSGVFVAFRDPARGDFSITRANENRLNSFAEGVQALADYLSKYVIIPPTQVDSGPEQLLNLAMGKAQAARMSGAAADASIARAVAESARDAARSANKGSIVSQAETIMSDMDKIIALGQGAAGKAIAATSPMPEWVTYAAIGGGVLVVLGVVYLVTKD